MTKLFSVLLPALLMYALGDNLYAQDHPGRDHSKPRPSPNGFVEQTVGTAQVSIAYSRPFVKGRDVFGGLEPYGKVWRAGANEATVIVFPIDVKVEGSDLPAGAYSLFTIPDEKEWTIIFNSQPKQWGAFSHNAELDVLRVHTNSRSAHHQEMLTYSFEEVTNEGATVVLHWGTTQIPFKVEIAK